MHLRYKLAPYQFNRIAPPKDLLIELKMAERLVKLESLLMQDPTSIISVNVDV